MAYVSVACTDNRAGRARVVKTTTTTTRHGVRRNDLVPKIVAPDDTLFCIGGGARVSHSADSKAEYNGGVETRSEYITRGRKKK